MSLGSRLMYHYTARWRCARTWFKSQAPRLRVGEHHHIPPAWVLLHLSAVSIGVALLEPLAGPVYGPSPHDEYIGSLFPMLRSAFTSMALLMLFVTTICACLLYLFLIAAHLHSRWWLILLSICLLMITIYLIGLHGTLAIQIRVGILAYGLAAYVRVQWGRNGGWLISGMVALAILESMLFKEALLPQAPFLPTILQYLVWLAGLIYIQSLCGLGVQEHTARIHSEQLVRDLLAAQEQLRVAALDAEELAVLHERERMAREIHDTVAQHLAAIRMHLEASMVTFVHEPTTARRHMEHACDLAGTSLREARRAILELRTEPSDEQPFATALEALASTWHPLSSDRGEAVCHVSAEVCALPLAFTVKTACYRVAQEALANAARHGHATQVEIEVSVEAQDLCMTITDNGCGFDPDDISEACARDSFGIKGMRERLHLVQGHLDIISAPGAGTQIAALIPIGEILGQRTLRQ